mgnify:CR=1 FL=1
MFDELTVTENIFIGNHLTKSNRLIDWALMESKTKQLLDELEANIEPNEKIKDLSFDYYQLYDCSPDEIRKIKKIHEWRRVCNS